MAFPRIVLVLALVVTGAIAEPAGAEPRVVDTDASTELGEPIVVAQRRRFRRPGSSDEKEKEEREAEEALAEEAGAEEAEGKDAPQTTHERREARRERKIERQAPVSPPGGIDYEFLAVPDRWRIVESLGVNERWWDPYGQNTLKGDRPIFGTQDWFVNLVAVSDTIFELRRVPTPEGVQVNAGPGALDIQGGNEQWTVSETLAASFSLIQGDTAFRPPNLEFRVSGAVNVNHTNAQNNGVLYADPSKGKSRTDWHFGFTELFIDKHLFDVSERYDFMSIRAGVQNFVSDFRGFLYSDNNLGVRLFGNLANNRLQYNLAYFRRIEKDTNSGLPKIFDLRDDDIVAANLYYQDFPIPGFTLQGTAVYNRNTETSDHYDENGFKLRPSPAGTGREHEYDVVYLGLNGDGHFDRLNVTFSLYYATGHDDDNFLAQKSQTISAWFFAGEASYDFDWWRLKAFGMYASGDDDPYDGWATGFDAIFDNPNFAGAETSYWHRQAVPLIFGGNTTLVGRDSLLPSLQTSKAEGQSNFTNPGLILVGIGADFDVLPQLRIVSNLSYLRFETTRVIEALRQEKGIDEEIGWDLSAGLIYRPFMTNNIALQASGAVLFPGNGLQDLYKEDAGDPLYSVLLSATFQY